MRTFAALKSICGSAVLLTGIADAHGGLENETEIRVYPDRMRIVTRSSLAFAWRLLGSDAPGSTDEAGKASAKPLLATAAAGLFTVSADGKPMAPDKSDCFFEVQDLHDHVAFTLDFKRPVAWPVHVEATFFPLLGELDEGSITVFDHSASRFSRDIEPLSRKSVSAKDPGISFSILAPEAGPGPAATNVPAASLPPPAEPAKNHWLLPLAFIAAGIAAWLARAAWQRLRRTS